MSRFWFRLARTRIITRPIALGMIAFAATSVTAASGLAAEPKTTLPVRSVALFSSGVAYTEHGGTLNGNADVQLNFKARQINDVLKSLVIEDRGTDGVRTRPGIVAFPSKEPLRRTLSSFQINLAKNPAMANILKQLRGATITARHQGEPINGTLLGVERRPMAVGKDGDVIQDWAMTVFAKGAMRTMALREITDIELSDPTLRAELASALAALDAGRNRTTKPVTVRFAGTGKRDVRLGYITEAPVWKTSYRVVLPSGPGTPYLQGWAIVENQSRNDWNNITLSLISGRPISFTQDLYTPLYAKRPEVPVQTQIPVAPKRHARGQKNRARSDTDKVGKNKKGAIRPSSVQAEERTAGLSAMLSDTMTSRAQEPRLDPTRTTAAATGEDVGELFEYTIDAVTLAHQQSAMLPIIAQSIEGEKISLFNEGTHRTRAMNGVILNNSTGLQLPAGAVTVYDGGLYAGDAMLDNLPKNQDRLITYAVDLDLDIQSSHPPGARAITSGRIVKGVLQMSYKSRQSRGYSIENKSDRAKTLIVETSKIKGWTLIDSPKPWQSTQALYRFKIALEANAQQELKVFQEFVHAETLALLNFDQARLIQFSRNGAFAPEVREALAKAAKLQQSVKETERRIKQRNAAVSTYSSEQKRVRDNLRSVSKTTKFHDRMMVKLDQLETAIEAAYSDIRKLQDQQAAQRATLEAYINGLNIG